MRRLLVDLLPFNTFQLYFLFIARGRDCWEEYVSLIVLISDLKELIQCVERNRWTGFSLARRMI